MSTSSGSRASHAATRRPFFESPGIRAIRRWLSLLAILLVAINLQPASVAMAAGIVVNTTADEFNTNPAACSLREAIQAANSNAAFGGCSAGAGVDTITFSVNGTFNLSRAGIDEDDNATGDLDLLGNLTITGSGPTNTIINDTVTERIFDTF